MYSIRLILVGNCFEFSRKKCWKEFPEALSTSIIHARNQLPNKIAYCCSSDLLKLCGQILTDASRQNFTFYKPLVYLCLFICAWLLFIILDRYKCILLDYVCKCRVCILFCSNHVFAVQSRVCIYRKCFALFHLLQKFFQRKYLLLFEKANLLFTFALRTKTPWFCQLQTKRRWALPIRVYQTLFLDWRVQIRSFNLYFCVVQ